MSVMYSTCFPRKWGVFSPGKSPQKYMAEYRQIRIRFKNKKNILVNVYKYIKLIKRNRFLHFCFTYDIGCINRLFCPLHGYLCRNVSKKYLRTCALSKDSDKPAHSHSLIRVFTRHISDSQGYKVSPCG